MTTVILWYVSRSTGAMAQILLTAVMVLGILTAGRAAPVSLSRAALLRLHRNLALSAVAFLVLHIATAIIDGYVDLRVLDVLVPFGSAFDPLWIGLGAVAVDLMLALIITSALRRRMQYRAWRIVHLSAYAMWPVAMLHGWGTSGGDSSARWMIAITVACVVAVVGSLVFRLSRPKSADNRARLDGAAHHAVLQGAPDQPTVLGAAHQSAAIRRDLGQSEMAGAVEPDSRTWGAPR